MRATKPTEPEQLTTTLEGSPMLTYAQASQRAWQAFLFALAIGFLVVAATRIQLAADLTTPLAFDITVWLSIISVALTAAAGAGVCAWMRLSNFVVVRRDRLRREAAAAEYLTEPLALQLPRGRHRLGADQ